MKISYDFGHGIGQDRGANGILNEEKVVREYGSLAICKLRRLGIECVNCTPTSATTVIDSLSQRCEKANASNSDLHLCFHANCFNSNAHGCEVEYTSNYGYNYAKKVCNEVSKLGFTNRGPKERKNLYILKHTKMAAILLEPFFVDNKQDYNRYNAELLANAIVKAITNIDLTVKNNGKEVYEMDKIVTYFGDADVFAAIVLAQKLGCAIIKESDLKTIKAKEIIKVGGPSSSFGKGNRFDTFKGVANKL